MSWEVSYANMVERVISRGEYRENRTGTGAFSLFSPGQIRADLEEEFPLVTLKETWFKGVAEELAWFLSGETNVRPLQEKGVHIWDEWADEDGELGPVYGAQWRNFGGIDQIHQVIDGLEADPLSRRLIVSAWNVPELPQMALAPCHIMFQFTTHKDNLNIHVYQRSWDLFLGAPFNIASYALLTHVIAKHTGFKVGELVYSVGDAHIYAPHFRLAQDMLQRGIKLSPAVRVTIGSTLPDFRAALEGYHPHPAIKAEVMV